MTGISEPFGGYATCITVHVEMNDRVQSSYQMLRRRRHGVTYADVFETHIFVPAIAGAGDAFARFLAATPLWAKLLFRAITRRRVSILFESNEAVVFGFDRAHMSFRSVLSLRSVVPPSKPTRTPTIITDEPVRLLRLDTAVLCHDRVGRACLWLVAPLHRRLMRSTLSRMLTVERRS